jgi:hypothetical protein
MEAPSLCKDDRIGKETNWVFQVKDCQREIAMVDCLPV